MEKKGPFNFYRKLSNKKNIVKREKLNSIEKTIIRNINVEFNSVKRLKKPNFNSIKNLVYKK